MALTAQQRRHFEGLPDPRRNVLSVGQTRRNEELHAAFSPSFRHLAAPAPSPMAGEWPADFEKRLVSTLVDEACHVLATATNRSPRKLTPDEVRLVRDHDMVMSRAALEAMGAEALGHVAARAHRIAAGLAADRSVGNFNGDGGLRVTETRGSGGHTIREYSGDPLSWMSPFMSDGQCCIGGQLARPLADVAASLPRPQPHHPPPPAALGPQPSVRDMLGDIVRDAVRAALPQRRGRK